MAIDRRKKLLKNLRLVRYDAFQKVCEQLDITYSFPPLYYRRATHRWIAKKAFCLKVAKHHHSLLDLYVRLQETCRSLQLTHARCDLCVRACVRVTSQSHSALVCVFSQVYKEVQKQKAEQQRMRLKQSSASRNTEMTKTAAA